VSFTLRILNPFVNKVSMIADSEGMASGWIMRRVFSIFLKRPLTQGDFFVCRL
jgi:hypothetical protein